MSNRPIDDIGERAKYKAAVFAGSEFTLDEYTGEPLIAGDSDTDHVIPLVKIKEMFPRLSDEQLKALANGRYNYAETNSSLNRSKGGLDNIEYVIRESKKGNPVDPATATRMVAKQGTATVTMGVRAPVMYMENFVDDAKEFAVTKAYLDKESLNAATQAAILSGTVSVIRNIRDVSAGEKTGKEALKDVASDVGGAAVAAYSVKFVTKGIAEGLGLSENSAVILAAGTIQIAKTAVAYVNGEITYERMQDEVAEKGGMIVAAYIGKNIGAAVGTAVGGAVGGYVGAFVGEVITTAICANIVEEIRGSRAFSDDISRSVSLARRAEREIQTSSERLKKIIDRENHDFLVKTDRGYNIMMEGILSCNYAKVKDGIMLIGTKFGMDEEELMAGTVERGHIFDHVDDVIEIC